MTNEVKELVLSATVMDAEYDPFVVTYDGEGCIKINTDGYAHIVLDVRLLKRLAAMARGWDAQWDEWLDSPEGLAWQHEEGVREVQEQNKICEPACEPAEGAGGGGR